MSDIVHVAAIWDDDEERWWFDECEPGDHDDDSNAFEHDVPADVWARRHNALVAWNEADRKLVEAIGLVDARRSIPCAVWKGDSFPGIPESWSVILAASDGSEWPIRNVSIGWTADTEAEAQSHLDDLPDEFWLYGSGPRPVLITKDRLTLRHFPATPPREYDCHRCGWPRGEHGAAS